MDDAQAYASDIGVLGVLRALSRLRGLILLPIIARGMGAATYGVWTQSLVFVTVGMSVILMQFDRALVRFVSGTDDRSRQRSIFLPILFLVIGLGAAASLVTILIPKHIASVLLGDPEYVAIARWLGVWAGLTALGQLGIQLQRALHKIKLYGFLGTLETLGQLVIVVAIILTTGDLLEAVLGAVGWELVFMLVVLGYGLHSVGLAWPDWSSLRPSLKFSLPLVPSYLGGTILQYADRLLIASQLGTEAVGVYAAAYSLARIVREMFIPISGALLPAVNRAWDRLDHAQAKWLFSNTLRLYTSLALPAIAGLTVLGKDVLALLARESIAQGGEWLIPVLGLAFLLSGVQGAFMVALQLVMDTPSLALSRVLASLVYLPILVLAISRWGLIGAAAATVVGNGLDMLLTAWLSRRSIAFRIPYLSFLRGAAAAIGMAALVWWMKSPGLLGLLASIVVGMLVYFGLLGLVGGIRRREVEFAKSFLSRVWNQ